MPGEDPVMSDESLYGAIEHISWTIEHSPKAYEMFRLRLLQLRADIMTAENNFMKQEEVKCLTNS